MSEMKVQSRRSFLKKSALLSAAAALPLTNPHVHAGETQQLKIGLIGCGGRGCGAASDAMTIDPNVKLVCAADIFEDRGRAGIKALKDIFDKRVTITPETLFFGFDAYKKVLAADVDVVILATPQHFRPTMLVEAIEANKHVFCEKPVAVDGLGIRMVLEAAKMASEKKLNLVSGLVNRYYSATQEVVKRIRGGAIGKIVCARAQRMGGQLWKRPRVEGDTEMMYQMRNWVNFDWIAAEYINDVTIHQIDVALWCMGDPSPVSAIGMGGRLARRQIDTGDMYDSMAVTYEFADGRFLQACSRQVPGAWGDATTYVYGSSGRAQIVNSGARCEIYGPKAFKATPSKVAGTQMEHKVLLDAIRSGGIDYVNNGEYMANSTMTCIMGRIAAYTGRQVTWEEALAFEQPKPSEYSWKGVPPTLPDDRGQYKIHIPHEGWGYLS